VELRPLPETRVACSTLGLGVVLLGGAAAVDPLPWLPVPLASVGILLGLYLAVRGYRVAVICDQHGITVRGYLWTRTVLRDQVTEVSDGTELPVLHWQDEHGRRRRTPIACLWTSDNGFRRYSDHSRRDLKRLRRWIHR
jgi:hypothetical protein